MDKNFTNTDDKFKDAFDSWEADFSPSEMRADWSKLSSKIAPLQSPPATQPLSNTFWTAGKMLGLVSSAAILTTAGIILYNTYIYDGEKIPSTYQPAVTIENNNTAANHTQIENNKNIAVDLNTEEDKAFSGQPIYGNGKNADKNTTQNGKENMAATDDKAVVQANDNSGKSTDLINNPNQPAANNRNDNAQQGEIRKIAGSISKKDLKYSDTVFCQGEELRITFSGVQLPEAAVVEWGDGDMQPFSKVNRHVYQKTGQYRVRIAYENKVLEKIIKVTELPLANFSNFECDKMKCKFRNTSKLAFNYVWNFGDGTPDVRGNHPEHQFNDTGRYVVTLSAYNAAGCVDSFVHAIRVTDYKKPEVFNVFTPNGDGDNDRFNVFITNEVYYHIKITDLNGGLVFESKDKNKSWDGTMFNQGTACVSGTYIYFIAYKYNLLDPIREEKGLVEIRR